MLKGNWVVTKFIQTNEIKKDSFSIDFSEKNSSKFLSCNYLNDQFEIWFSGLSILSLYSKNEKIAFFNFYPILPPKLTSYGEWNQTSFYNSAILSLNYFQLSVFSSEKTVHFIFEKPSQNSENDPNYNSSFIIFGIFLCSGFVILLKYQKKRTITKQN
jgi:hypothetical protein